MVNVRPQPARREARFNVLLTRDREQNIEHWTRQLPRLMQPLGVEAYVATTGSEALDLAQEHPIHAALIDLHTPKAPGGSGDPANGGGGHLAARGPRALSPKRPPVVVVNTRTYTPGSAQRFLNTALRLGAFSVIDQPHQRRRNCSPSSNASWTARTRGSGPETTPRTNLRPLRQVDLSPPA